VGGDVRAHVGEEVGAVAGGAEGGAEPGELALVVGEDFAVAGEVVLFQGGGGEGGFGVEEAGELGDEGVALGGVSSEEMCGRVRTGRVGENYSV